MARKIRGKIMALAKDPRRGVKIGENWFNVAKGDDNLLAKARDLKGKFVEASVEGNVLLDVKEIKRITSSSGKGKTNPEILELKLKYFEAVSDLAKYFHSPSESLETMIFEIDKLVRYLMFGEWEEETKEEEKPQWEEKDYNNTIELEIKHEPVPDENEEE